MSRLGNETFYQRYGKRVIDLCLSLVLLILFWWVLAIVAILVRVKLGSPVLFRQPRPGRDEKVFNLYKFRTMNDDRDADGNLLPDERRLTKFGRALRSTSLDELPEVFNIVRGDMAIIGPRPLLVEYLPYYNDRERLRHCVRPGLTGLAQVNGRNSLKWGERFELDVEYVESIDLANDVHIFLRTIGKALSRSDVSDNTAATEGNFAEIRSREIARGKQPMSNGTNILILSAGTRDKVVQYFKRSLAGRGRVLATDMSEYAPAIYEADEHFIVPSMTDEGYLDVILGICRDNDVKGVLSLIDPELSLLAKNAGRFEAVGTTVIGSSYDLCELALDKFEMFKWLSSHGYRCARSWMDRGEFHRALECGEVGFPVFVKPARGSASLAISKVSDANYLDLMLAQGDGLMIQEFLDGQEIGADVYVDIVSGKVVSIFTKKKLKMRAGETDKAVSFKDPVLFELIERFVGETGFKGQVDIDVFYIGGEYYISEVNPRFGGGYPHAYESGCDHIELIVNNLDGVANKPRIGEYDEGIVMMKYNEIMTLRG